LQAEKKAVEANLLACFDELRTVCSDFNYQREVYLSIQLVEEKREITHDPQEVARLTAVVKVFKKKFDTMWCLEMLFRSTQHLRLALSASQSIRAHSDATPTTW
jgi:hypothetical protein